MSKRKENIKLVFKAIGILVLLLIVFVLIMNKVKLGQVSKRLISLPRKPAGGSLGHWMANLPPEIKKQPITRLKIVGTHDSQAYQLLDYPMPGNISGKIKWSHANTLQKHVGLGKEFISDWTLTQNKDIFTQLCQGVRAFDLRVSHVSNGRFIYSHSLACDYVENILDQIADFIKFHPNELIFLWSKPDWIHKDTFTNDIAAKYVQLVNNKLGQVLVPYHSGDLKSLHDYTNVGKKNVFFMMDPVISNPLVWDYDTIKYQWNPTIDKNELYQWNLDIVRNSQALSNRLVSIGLTMSPDNTVIVQELKKRINPFRKKQTLKEFSQPIQDQYNMLLRDTGSREKIGNINIWWTDFPTDTFINTIIKSNY